MPSWTKYQAKLKITDRVIGGIPVVSNGADRADAYEAWARGQGIRPPEYDENAAPELAEKLAEDEDMPVSEEEIEGLRTGFKKDGQGLYLEARQTKAMLREAATRLGLTKSKRGMRQVVQHDLHVRALDGSQKLRLVSEDGSALSEPSGTERRAISVITRQGPRTAIKTFDYASGVTVEFEVRVLTNGVADGLLTDSDLREMLELAEWLGLGADRSQGEGTFTLLEFEKIEESE